MLHTWENVLMVVSWMVMIWKQEMEMYLWFGRRRLKCIYIEALNLFEGGPVSVKFYTKCFQSEVLKRRAAFLSCPCCTNGPEEASLFRFPQPPKAFWASRPQRVTNGCLLWWPWHGSSTRLPLSHKTANLFTYIQVWIFCRRRPPVAPNNVLHCYLRSLTSPRFFPATSTTQTSPRYKTPRHSLPPLATTHRKWKFPGQLSTLKLPPPHPQGIASAKPASENPTATRPSPTQTAPILESL